VDSLQKAGFVAVVGRPNAGKSTFLNYLVGEKLALVSQKANATRKRMQIIVTHKDAQLVFIDTPGIHERERELNKFMLEEVLRAMGDCDIICFLSPFSDSLEHYERFLELSGDKKHIVLLTKIDLAKDEDILKKLEEFSVYADRYLDIVPMNTKKAFFKNRVIELISKHLPHHEFYYDPDEITSSYVKDIYKELIREALFENFSDEIPYSSDILIEKMEEGAKLDRVFARIVVEKDSQKGMVIGNKGEAIKRLGFEARKKLEEFSGKKIYLELFVKVDKNWTNNKTSIENMGYA